MVINKIDKRILSILFGITLVGLIVLYSASYQSNHSGAASVFLKQIFWFCIGWSLLIALAHLNYKVYYDSAYIFYGATLLLLLIVLAIGRRSLGAQRWIQLWIFNFQPSELAKLTLMLVMARYFCKKSVFKFNSSLSSLNFIEIVIIPLMFASVSILLVFLQPDLGTAIVLGILVLGMILTIGVNIKYIISVFVVGLLSMPFAWSLLKDYQRDRLLVFINPNLDPLGAGYTIIQSKIAIGSGGFFGKGLLSGTQSQLNFLPERHTDFIFSVIAEEWGFVGGIILLTLYFLLLQRIFSISSRVKDPFACFLCIGTILILSLHIIINIAMATGICPVVGLPLPFISYGGSNLMLNFILLGIILNIQKVNNA